MFIKEENEDNLRNYLATNYTSGTSEKNSFWYNTIQVKHIHLGIVQGF